MSGFGGRLIGIFFGLDDACCIIFLAASSAIFRACSTFVTEEDFDVILFDAIGCGLYTDGLIETKL